MTVLVYCTCILSLFNCMLCLCCYPPLRDILHTVVARFSLFVLKVPLNKQTKLSSDSLSRCFVAKLNDIAVVVDDCCSAASFLSQYKYCRELDLSPSPRPCCLVVDCGYSFTHLIPYYDGRPVRKAIRRYVDSIPVSFSVVYRLCSSGTFRGRLYLWS